MADLLGITVIGIFATIAGLLGTTWDWLKEKVRDARS